MRQICVVMDNIVDAVYRLLNKCNKSEIEIEARIRRQLVDDNSQRMLIDNLGVEWTTVSYTEKRKISKSNRKSAYRQRNNTTICKSSIAREDANDTWCALHVSVEVPTPSMSGMLINVAPVSVTRQRAEVGGHYVDVIHDDVQGYRVEVEVCDPENFDIERTLCVVKRVCAALQGSREFVGYYDWFTIVHITRRSFGQLCIDKGRYQKPQTMTWKNLLDMANVDVWKVTPKIDGERRFIIILSERVFSVGLLKDVRLEGKMPDNKQIHILDCEYAKGDFHVFDAIVTNGEYIGDDESLDDRLETAKNIISVLELTAKINVKPYYSFDCFETLCNLYDTFKAKYDIDGMVFVNNTEEYMQTVLKWKPHNTVDLMFTNEGKLVTSDEHDMTHLMAVPVEHKGIWEFIYDAQTVTLSPLRYRPDKPRANSRKIIESNVRNPIPESVFSGVGCHMMRKYHNRVKRDMIDVANSNCVILDIGTGQGGDLQKWKKAVYVYCVEPRLDSISEMQDRMQGNQGMSDKIQIINTYIRDLDYSLIDDNIGLFTAFFCMNHFHDSDFDALIKIIKEKGSKNCQLLATAITKPRNYKSKCFEVTMNGEDKYFIDMYDTRISGINEQKVNIDRLSNLMKECGMVLRERKLLNEEPFMTKDERILSSMYEMFVYSKLTKNDNITKKKSPA